MLLKIVTLKKDFLQSDIYNKHLFFPPMKILQVQITCILKIALIIICKSVVHTWLNVVI